MRYRVEQSDQLPGECGVQRQPGQLFRRNEARLQPWFPAVFASGQRFVGDEDDVKQTAVGSRWLGLNDERNPGRVGRDAGLLKQFTARTRHEALALTRSSPGQHPVIQPVTCAVDQQDSMPVHH